MRHGNRVFFRSSVSVRNYGFSLIELLTILGILAVLVTVIFAVSGSILKSSANARCVSNLRTLAAAHLLYTSENNGQFVPYVFEDVTWTAALRDKGFLEEKTGAFFCPAFPKTTDLKTPDAVARISGGLGTKKRGIYSHYGYNHMHLGSSLRESGLTGDARNEPARVASLSHPAKTLLLIESITSLTSDTPRGYYIVPDRPGAQHLPHLRHQGINAAFADGHVAMLPLNQATPWASPPEGVGTTSNPDSLWKR